MTQHSEREAEAAASYILKHGGKKAGLGIVLGSGLGALADSMQEAVRLPYEDIPGFPVSTVEGHKGQLVLGRLGNVDAIVQQGRFHYYEGYSLKEVTFAVRVMRALGVHTLILTNAAGAVNVAYTPGDLMLISDHLNMLGNNPLTGRNESGPRFPDLSDAYSRELREQARAAAGELGLELREGVYACMGGPTYETPAEVRMLRILGADAVGMSTVPETICAVHAGMRVLGVSCITNMAAGILDQPLSHAEVMETSENTRSIFLAFMQALISKLEVV